MVQRYETLSRRTIRLSPNTYLTILAQDTTFTVLVVVLHHFFEIFPCFHYQTVLITDAKVIYYIGTAIRANGDLLKFDFLHQKKLYEKTIANKMSRAFIQSSAHLIVYN